MSYFYPKTEYKHSHQQNNKKSPRNNKVTDIQYRIINPNNNNFFRSAKAMSSRKSSIQSINQKIKDYFNMPLPQKDIVLQTKTKIKKCHSQSNVCQKNNQQKHKCLKYETKPVYCNKQTIIHEYFPSMSIQKQRDLTLQNKYSISIRPANYDTASNNNNKSTNFASVQNVYKGNQTIKNQIFHQIQNRTNIQTKWNNSSINKNLYPNSMIQTQKRQNELIQNSARVSQVTPITPITPITQVRYYYPVSTPQIKPNIVSPFREVQQSHVKKQSDFKRHNSSNQINQINNKREQQQSSRARQIEQSHHKFQNQQSNQTKQISQRHSENSIYNFNNNHNSSFRSQSNNLIQNITKKNIHYPYSPNKQCIYENFYQEYFQSDYPFNMFEHNEHKKEIKRKEISLKHFTQFLDDILFNTKDTTDIQRHLRELQEIKTDNIQQGKHYLSELENFICKYSGQEIKRSDYAFYYWDFLKQRNNNQKMPKLMLTQKLVKKSSNKQHKKVNNQGQQAKKITKIFQRKNLQNYAEKSQNRQNFQKQKQIQQKKLNLSNYSRVIQYGIPTKSDGSEYLQQKQISHKLLKSEVKRKQAIMPSNKIGIHQSCHQPARSMSSKKIKMTLQRQKIE